MAFGRTHKGKYKPKNPEKYKGNVNDVVYRSSWERGLCRWCDMNSSVLEWSSEEVVIPYKDASTNKTRRYFIDFYIKWKNGRVTLVEVKPLKQTQRPSKPKRQTKRFIEESLTYVKNQSKWEAASQYAKRRGWTFQVWTERELKKMGAIKW